MRAVCLVDTSIFVEILNVPGKNSHRNDIIAEFKRKIEQGESFLLPMATILETGNHIAKNGNGNQRRECAIKFVEQVRMAIEGGSPFAAVNFLEANDLATMLATFPDSVQQGIGLGDQSIIHDWQRQKILHPKRRVYIWSLDDHLRGFDSRPQ